MLGCALAALWAAPLSAAESPREHLSLDPGWYSAAVAIREKVQPLLESRMKWAARFWKLRVPEGTTVVWCGRTFSGPAVFDVEL
jgi:hypothetical protein